MYRHGSLDCRIFAPTGNVICWLPRHINLQIGSAFCGRDPAALRFSSRPPIHLSHLYIQEKVIHVANIKSQIKRIGTNKKAQERNKAVKSELKTAIRATNKAVAAGDKAAAATSLTLAGKKLDKAVSKGVIHKNQAANRKSAIAKQVAAL
jgi:small subunit ribosomal protein S20